MNKNISKNGVEILCIGTELLLGNIINSNAKYLAEELASIGLPHYRQSVVGDNSKRLKEMVLEASKRSRILITTGGLGPTPDDLTTETIASIFKSPLKARPELWEDIKKKLSPNEKGMPLSNQKQIFFPEKATIIPNPTGTAAGMIWTPINQFTIITFPGVPSELKRMWQETAIPWLRNYADNQHTIVSKILRFSGIKESTLAEQVADLLTNENPTLAPYAGTGEVKLRLTARAKNTEEALSLLRPLEANLRKKTGSYCYGVDHETLASVVINQLRQRGETLGIAESCTGGGICATLTETPGASDVFLGGLVVYSNLSKQKILGIPSELINKHGAVSEHVVKAMANAALQKLHVDWSIAVSGVAGPGGGTKTKPVGLVHFAIAGPFGCESFVERFGAHRERIAIQKLSVVRGLDYLRLLLVRGV